MRESIQLKITALKNRIKKSQPYKGHAFTIDFRNSHVNSSVFIEHVPSFQTTNQKNNSF